MVFGDTSFFVTFINSDDAWHKLAQRLLVDLREPILTTDWVLIEVADAFASVKLRPRFVTFLNWVHSDPFLRLLPSDRGVLERSIELYIKRPDKDWSLTDCTSMTVMNEHDLTRALTHDHHFEQAGFVAMMREAEA